MPGVHSARRVLFALSVVCVCPAVAAAQMRPAQDTRLALPTIAASAAAAADWLSTHHALSNYQVRETNPLLRPFEHRPGRMVSLGAIMDGVAFSTWNMTIGREHPKVAAAGLWGMAAFRTYLAIHNMRNTRRVPRR